MVRPVAAALVIAALVAAALLARGGGGEDGRVARAQGGRVAVILDDFRFRPQAIRASRGRVTLELRNAGRLAHGFRLRKGGREWIRQPSLSPGEAATVSRYLEPGAYRMYDPLSNYEELGMHGTLVVR